MDASPRVWCFLRVPSQWALGPSHFVLYLKNASLANMFSTSSCYSSPSSPPTSVRVDHLSGSVLSSMLRCIQQHVSKTASFTFAVSGGRQECSATTPAEAHSLQNAVLAQVLYRTPADFVPNNLVYHRMQQQFYLPLLNYPRLVKKDLPLAFAEWLKKIQQQPEESEEDPLRHYSGDDDKDLELPKVPDYLRNPDVVRQMETENVAISSSSLLHSDDRVQGAEFSGAINNKSNLGRRVFHFFPYTNTIDAVAFATAYFVVLVNLKPVVPGHVLLVPKRIIHSVHEMTEDEVNDWGSTLRKTLDVLGRVYPLSSNEEGFSIAIQCGRAAGQTVWHQHTHIIPYSSRSRLAGEPEEGDEEEQARRPPRTALEMKQEASELRRLFYGGSNDGCNISSSM